MLSRCLSVFNKPKVSGAFSGFGGQDNEKAEEQAVLRANRKSLVPTVVIRVSATKIRCNVWAQSPWTVSLARLASAIVAIAVTR